MKRLADLTAVIPIATELVEHIALSVVAVVGELGAAVNDAVARIKQAWLGG